MFLPLSFGSSLATQFAGKSDTASSVTIQKSATCLLQQRASGFGRHLSLVICHFSLVLVPCPCVLSLALVSSSLSLFPCRLPLVPCLHRAIHPSIDLSIHRSIHPSIHRSIHPSIHRSIDPCIHRSIDPYVYIYIYIYICCVVLYITSKVYYYTAVTIAN